MVTTTTTYGAEFSYQVQADGILAYINGADYTDAAASAVFEALFREFRAEVNNRLPEGVTWFPHTSEFVHPVGADIPSEDDMRELFTEAWQAVEARYDDIEREALA